MAISRPILIYNAKLQKFQHFNLQEHSWVVDKVDPDGIPVIPCTFHSGLTVSQPFLPTFDQIKQGFVNSEGQIINFTDYCYRGVKTKDGYVGAPSYAVYEYRYNPNPSANEYVHDIVCYDTCYADETERYEQATNKIKHWKQLFDNLDSNIINILMIHDNFLAHSSDLAPDIIKSEAEIPFYSLYKAKLELESYLDGNTDIPCMVLNPNFTKIKTKLQKINDALLIYKQWIPSFSSVFNRLKTQQQQAMETEKRMNNRVMSIITTDNNISELGELPVVSAQNLHSSNEPLASELLDTNVSRCDLSLNWRRTD